MYPLKILSRKAWLMLILLAVCFFSALVWLLLGSVKTQVLGKGLLLTQNGTIQSVSSPEEGSQIETIHVIPDEKVKKNELLVELENPALDQNIKVTKNYIQTLKQEYQALEKKAEEATLEEADLLKKKENMVKKIITIEEENVNNLRKLTETYTKMLSRGLSTQRDTTQILNELNRSKQKLEQSYQMLLEIELSKKEKQQIWEERLRELNLQIENEQFKLNQLNEKKILSETLKSPIEGIVLSLQASPGDVVRKGQPILTLSNLGEGLDLIAFFPPDQGKKIQIGMRALVTPLIIKPEEYGNMIGTVIKVSPFPANDQVMLAILKNENLVRTFAKQSAPLIVRIRINQDPTTASGYAWTSSDGPPGDITPGTVSDVKVVIKRQAPWTLILPTIKKLLGSS